MKLGKYAVFIFSASTFWVPSIIIHALRGNSFGAGDIAVITVLSVILSVLTYRFLLRSIGSKLIQPISSFLFLYGIWALGPLGTMAGASFSGGGFAQPGTLKFSLIAAAIYPHATFIMATYDGTLGALLIATVWMVTLTIVGVVRLRAGHNKEDAPDQKTVR